jgi:hypothetical protein
MNSTREYKKRIFFIEEQHSTTVPFAFFFTCFDLLACGVPLGVDVSCQEIVSRPHASLSKIRFLLLSVSVPASAPCFSSEDFVREPPVRVAVAWIPPICRLIILAEQGRRRLVSSLPRFSGPALQWFSVLLPARLSPFSAFFGYFPRVFGPAPRFFCSISLVH